MTKTPAELQIELLKRMKAGRVQPAPPGSDAVEAPAAGAAKAVRPKRATVPVKSMNVDAKTWGRLEERRRAEFKDSRQMAAWAARLVLALPIGVAGLDAAAQDELFKQMRAWAQKKGLGD